MAWDPIVAFDAAGEAPVYDIEVEGTHNFLANGIIAHNTSLEPGPAAALAQPPGPETDAAPPAAEPKATSDLPVPSDSRLSPESHVLIEFAEGISPQQQLELNALLGDQEFFPEQNNPQLARIAVREPSEGSFAIFYQVDFFNSRGNSLGAPTWLRVYHRKLNEVIIGGSLRLNDVVQTFVEVAHDLETVGPALGPGPSQAYIRPHPEGGGHLVAVRSPFIAGTTVAELLRETWGAQDPEQQEQREALIARGIGAYLQMHRHLGYLPYDPKPDNEMLDHATGNVRIVDVELTGGRLTSAHAVQTLRQWWVDDGSDGSVTEVEFEIGLRAAAQAVYGDEAPAFLRAAGLEVSPDSAAPPAPAAGEGGSGPADVQTDGVAGTTEGAVRSVDDAEDHE